MEKRRPVLCVFCGSSSGTNPAHARVAREFGAGLARRDFAMLFGGGDRGLMGEAARAARAGGAEVTGVIPDFLLESEPPMPGEKEVVVTGDLQSRKAIMLGRADGFAVLPGGLGTLDEFFEIVTTAQLGVHKKPIVAVNTDGYFDGLERLLAQIVHDGFAERGVLSLYRLAATPEEALDFLTERLALKV